MTKKEMDKRKVRKKMLKDVESQVIHDVYKGVKVKKGKE